MTTEEEVAMTTAGLQAYASVIGMPSLTPINCMRFFARVRFFEQLFGPLVVTEKHRFGVWIKESDVLNRTLRFDDAAHETNANFADRMYRTWRRTLMTGP